MRTRNHQAPRPDKRIVEQLPRSRKRQIRHQQRELGVHTRGADVRSFLETVGVNGVPSSPGDQSAEVDLFWSRATDTVVVVEFFADDEFLVGVLHGDASAEGEVAEGVYDLRLRGGGVGAIEDVEGEFEGCGCVEGPEVRGLGLDLGVELGVGGGGGPEGVDGLAEDGAAEEGVGVVGEGEADEAVGGLCGGGLVGWEDGSREGEGEV